MKLALPNPNPVVTEPVPVKEYPHLWLYNINVHVPTPTSGRVSIETLPYNSDTQEIGSGNNAVVIQTDDMWRAIQEVPEVAQVMASIFAAIEPLRNWIAEKEAEKAIENSETPQ